MWDKLRTRNGHDLHTCPSSPFLAQRVTHHPVFKGEGSLYSLGTKRVPLKSKGGGGQPEGEFGKEGRGLGMSKHMWRLIVPAVLSSN